MGKFGDGRVVGRRRGERGVLGGDNLEVVVDESIGVAKSLPPGDVHGKSALSSGALLGGDGRDEGGEPIPAPVREDHAQLVRRRLEGELAMILEEVDLEGPVGEEKEDAVWQSMPVEEEGGLLHTTTTAALSRLHALHRRLPSH